MGKKVIIYVAGLITGTILTFGVLFIIGSIHQKKITNDQYKYLEHPLSYEGKKETSFKVFQVMNDAALANEISSEFTDLSDDDFEYYDGNVVVIPGEDFYTDQIVRMKNPKRIGTYSYTTKSDMPMTVPVIEGDIE